ncbi:hypothetical protein TNCV_3833981 [Trichonephila clavipes]|nr:hypothetical protein TNCV_3833981 [Trichonephila clavipes]
MIVVDFSFNFQKHPYGCQLGSIAKFPLNHHYNVRNGVACEYYNSNQLNTTERYEKSPALDRENLREEPCPGSRELERRALDRENRRRALKEGRTDIGVERKERR